MSAGNDTHTAVLPVAPVNRQPDCHQTCELFKSTVPVSGVRVPGSGSTCLRFLADEVTRPEPDIPADQALHDVEHRLVKEKLKQSFVVKMGRVELI